MLKNSVSECTDCDKSNIQSGSSENCHNNGSEENLNSLLDVSDSNLAWRWATNGFKPLMTIFPCEGSSVSVSNECDSL